MTAKATIIADSVDITGTRLTTFVLCYPRIIHSEFMTHRMFARNASSSRAIPFSKTRHTIQYNPFAPRTWTANKPGMQGDEITDAQTIHAANDVWKQAASAALHFASQLNEMGIHKQHVNRLLEPFSYIKTIVTATEWDNFFNLRLHPAAAPEIFALAAAMHRAYESHTPEEVFYTEQWHAPFITDEEIPLFNRDIDIALVSAARCARVSYLNHDQSEPEIDRDLALASRLLENKHMSPFEHVARPIFDSFPGTKNYVGVTHHDRVTNSPWSGPIKNWAQLRHVLEEEPLDA